MGQNRTPKSLASRTNNEINKEKRSIVGSNSFNRRFGVGLNPTGKSPMQPADGRRPDAAPQSVPASPDPLPRHAPRRDQAPAQGSLAARQKQINKGDTPLTVRDAVIRKRAGARFELLPEQKPLWNRIGWSAAGQLTFLGCLLLSPTIFPQQMQTALKCEAVEVIQPVTHIHIAPTTPPPTPPKIKRELPSRDPKPIVPKPKPVVVEPPALNPRQPHIFLVLKPEMPKVRSVEAKPVELKPVFRQTEIVLTSKQPVRPKEEVKTDASSPGAAPATLTAPLNKVQTGGHGNPNGVSGPGNPNKAANINQAGSPHLPAGPGCGNGTGGAQGARGTGAAEGPTKSSSAAEGATTGVDILYMPNPAYSIEGRTRKMEGDVVLEVVFLGSGQVQVVRVVSGLGYGLDEAAIQAAKQIRFKPAKRDGQPVDFPAHVRIEFRMAQ